MAESKHTPGPWLLDGHNLSAVIRCLRPKGHPEATHVCGDYEQIATAQGRNWAPNARLIAAAPEMLEELELQAIALRREMERTNPRECVRLVSLQARLTRIEAAIAKAEGR